jgi:hypothetical protein
LGYAEQVHSAKVDSYAKCMLKRDTVGAEYSVKLLFFSAAHLEAIVNVINLC